MYPIWVFRCQRVYAAEGRFKISSIGRELLAGLFIHDLPRGGNFTPFATWRSRSASLTWRAAGRTSTRVLQSVDMPPIDFDALASKSDCLNPRL